MSRLDPLSDDLEAAVSSYLLWLEARGTSKSARACFASRLRRYLRWFERHYGIHPRPSKASGQAVFVYREDLYRQGRRATYVRPLVYVARTYHTWAVEAGWLDEPPLPPMQRPPPGRRRKQPDPPYFSVPFVGRENYLDWAARQGLSPTTLRHYRGTLSSIARWLRDSRGEMLAPTHASPRLVRSYYRETDRSPSSFESGYFALRSYARWATQERLLSKDPFVSPRPVGFIDPSERSAFAAWLAAQGYSPLTVRSRLDGLAKFGRWFYHARRHMLSRDAVGSDDLPAYLRWLRRPNASARRSRRLAPGTVRALVLAARRYLEWASS